MMEGYEDDHEDDIEIGDDQWIEFIDLTGRYDLAVNIDDLLAPIEDYLHSLETVCRAACCGFDAYDFTPQRILNAARDHERFLLGRIGGVIQSLKQVDAEVIVSRKMNNYADKKVMLQLLEHIYRTIEETQQ